MALFFTFRPRGKKCDALYLSHKMDKEGLIVRILGNGKSTEVRTKILVGADGAASRVRLQADPAFGKMSCLALQYWFKKEGECPFYTSVFDRSITDFYSWIIQKEEFLIVGSALSAGKEAKKNLSF